MFDEATPVVVEPPHEPPRNETVFTTRNVVGGTAAVLGVAAATVGLVFLIDSNGKASDAKTFNGGFANGACREGLVPSNTYGDQLEDARSSRTVATVGLIGGGVLAAAAIATIVFWPSTRRSAAAGLMRPMVGMRDLRLGLDF